MDSKVPSIRITAANDAPVREGGDYVLYWMTAARRTTWNHSLDRAVDWARHLGKPLLVFEALRCDYRWACDRFHAFVIQGMVDQARYFASTNVGYYPYVEPSVGASKGQLASLARQACVVVTDEFPCFFLPRLVAAAAERLPVLLETVDSNGLMPLAASERLYVRAVDFRRFVQKTLPSHLSDAPRREALAEVELPPFAGLPAEIEQRWPALNAAELNTELSLSELLARLPIDHSVGVVEEHGGELAARQRLGDFLHQRLGRYGEGRNDVVRRVTSELSASLHFGHLSTCEFFDEIASLERWHPGKLASKANGSRAGWWGMSEAAEGYLDQIVTWRELGYHFCKLRLDDYDQYDALPEWSLKTLADHQADHRPYIYSLEEFELAATHDELWNAAQNELRQHGRIHNYLRMLWGKKVLEWSPSPRTAVEILIELNNKYAVDGRNPNSYSGIFWCFGRFDRAWGPERPIFGKVRYMTSDSTRRKLDAKSYIRQFGGQPKQLRLL